MSLAAARARRVRGLSGARLRLRRRSSSKLGSLSAAIANRSAVRVHASGCGTGRPWFRYCYPLAFWPIVERESAAALDRSLSGRGPHPPGEPLRQRGAFVRERHRSHADSACDRRASRRGERRRRFPRGALFDPGRRTSRSGRPTCNVWAGTAAIWPRVSPPTTPEKRPSTNGSAAIRTSRTTNSSRASATARPAGYVKRVLRIAASTVRYTAIRPRRIQAASG